MGQKSMCSLLSFKSRYCLQKNFSLYFRNEEEVRKLVPKEDLYSHIDIGTLELHVFAVLCKEGLRLLTGGADGCRS